MMTLPLNGGKFLKSAILMVNNQKKRTGAHARQPAMMRRFRRVNFMRSLFWSGTAVARLDSLCLLAGRVECVVMPWSILSVEARDPILRHRNFDERAGWEACVANFVLILSSNFCLKPWIGL